MEKLKLLPHEQEEFLAHIKEQLENCKRVSDLNFSLAPYMKNKFENIKKPVIQITPEAYIKMFQYVQLSTTEIAWHGLVSQDKENQIYKIYDVFLFPQINSAAATTTNTQEFGDWIEKKIIDFSFPFEDMRLHGHSHVNMSVFSSSIDDGYQKELLTNVKDGDYYLFLVLNKKHEICPLLYDLDQKILFTEKDIIIQVLDNKGVDILSDTATEIKMNCTTSYNSTKFKKTNYGIFEDYNTDDLPLFTKGVTHYGLK